MPQDLFSLLCVQLNPTQKQLQIMLLKHQFEAVTTFAFETNLENSVMMCTFESDLENPVIFVDIFSMFYNTSPFNG